MSEMPPTLIAPTERPENRETKFDFSKSLNMFKESLNMAREEAEEKYNKIKAELSDLIEERKKLKNNGVIQTNSTTEEIDMIDKIVLCQADKSVQMAVLKKLIKVIENINEQIKPVLNHGQKSPFQTQNAPSKILEMVNYSLQEIAEIIAESDPHGPMEDRIKQFLSETDRVGRKYFNWDVISDQKMFAKNLIFEITYYRDIFKSLSEKINCSIEILNNFEVAFSQACTKLCFQKNKAQSKLAALLSERARLEKDTGDTAITNESIETTALTAGKITILLNSAQDTIQELEEFRLQIENEKLKLEHDNIVVNKFFLIEINVLIGFLVKKMNKINMKNPLLKERAEDYLLHDTDQKGRENFDFDLTDEYVGWANNLIEKLNELKNKLKSYAT